MTLKGGAQEEGWTGRQVGAMIRRSVRRTFRNVYWQPPAFDLDNQAILVANHHGWHDGYLMYHLVTKLGLRSLDWIAEFAAFPLFGRVGGMPFPPDDPIQRVATIRKTIRLMQTERRSLVLFAEGELHPPPELLPFGKALQSVSNAVPSAVVVPVSIRYAMDLHQRPEAFLLLGEPVPPGPELPGRTRAAVTGLLERSVLIAPSEWQVLARGTLDVNERWDMRRRRRKLR